MAKRPRASVYCTIMAQISNGRWTGSFFRLPRCRLRGTLAAADEGALRSEDFLLEDEWTAASCIDDSALRIFVFVKRLVNLLDA